MNKYTKIGIIIFFLSIPAAYIPNLLIVSFIFFFGGLGFIIKGAE